MYGARGSSVTLAQQDRSQCANGTEVFFRLVCLELRTRTSLTLYLEGQELSLSLRPPCDTMSPARIGGKLPVLSCMRASALRAPTPWIYC